MNKPRRLVVTELNPHLICILCGGYFIDATTIVECLHSFCKSCIVRYLETSKFCPICDVQVHKTNPLLSIRPDKIIQDAVYKLIPRLYQNEMHRRRSFYGKHKSTKPVGPEDGGKEPNRRYFLPEDTLSIALMPLPSTKLPLEEKDREDFHVRYFHCPARVTIGQLQKLLRAKFNLPLLHPMTLLTSAENPLPSDLTLIDVAYIKSWQRTGPLQLYYKIYFTKRLKLDPDYIPSELDVDKTVISSNDMQSILNNAERTSDAINHSCSSTDCVVSSATKVISFSKQISIASSSSLFSTANTVSKSFESMIGKASLGSVESYVPAYKPIFPNCPKSDLVSINSLGFASGVDPLAASNCNVGSYNVGVVQINNSPFSTIIPGGIIDASNLSNAVIPVGLALAPGILCQSNVSSLNSLGLSAPTNLTLSGTSQLPMDEANNIFVNSGTLQVTPIPVNSVGESPSPKQSSKTRRKKAPKKILMKGTLPILQEKEVQLTISESGVMSVSDGDFSKEQGVMNTVESEASELLSKIEGSIMCSELNSDDSKGSDANDDSSSSQFKKKIHSIINSLSDDVENFKTDEKVLTILPNAFNTLPTLDSTNCSNNNNNNVALCDQNNLTRAICSQKSPLRSLPPKTEDRVKGGKKDIKIQDDAMKYITKPAPVKEKVNAVVKTESSVVGSPTNSSVEANLSKRKSQDKKKSKKPIVFGYKTLKMAPKGWNPTIPRDKIKCKLSLNSGRTNKIFKTRNSQPLIESPPKPDCEEATNISNDSAIRSLAKDGIKVEAVLPSDMQQIAKKLCHSEKLLQQCASNESCLSTKNDRSIINHLKQAHDMLPCTVKSDSSKIGQIYPVVSSKTTKTLKDGTILSSDEQHAESFKEASVSSSKKLLKSETPLNSNSKQSCIQYADSNPVVSAKSPPKKHDIPFKTSNKYSSKEKLTSTEKSQPKLPVSLPLSLGSVCYTPANISGPVLNQSTSSTASLLGAKVITNEVSSKSNNDKLPNKTKKQTEKPKLKHVKISPKSAKSPESKHGSLMSSETTQSPLSSLTKIKIAETGNPADCSLKHGLQMSAALISSLQSASDIILPSAQIFDPLHLTPDFSLAASSAFLQSVSSLFPATSTALLGIGDPQQNTPNICGLMYTLASAVNKFPLPINSLGVAAIAQQYAAASSAPPTIIQSLIDPFQVSVPLLHNISLLQNSKSSFPAASSFINNLGLNLSIASTCSGNISHSSKSIDTTNSSTSELKIDDFSVVQTLPPVPLKALESSNEDGPSPLILDISTLKAITSASESASDMSLFLSNPNVAGLSGKPVKKGEVKLPLSIPSSLTNKKRAHSCISTIECAVSMESPTHCSNKTTSSTLSKKRKHSAIASNMHKVPNPKNNPPDTERMDTSKPISTSNIAYKASKANRKVTLSNLKHSETDLSSTNVSDTVISMSTTSALNFTVPQISEATPISLLTSLPPSNTNSIASGKALINYQRSPSPKSQPDICNIPPDIINSMANLMNLRTQSKSLSICADKIASGVCLSDASVSTSSYTSELPHYTYSTSGPIKVSPDSTTPVSSLKTPVLCPFEVPHVTPMSIAVPSEPLLNIDCSTVNLNSTLTIKSGAYQNIPKLKSPTLPESYHCSSSHPYPLSSHSQSLSSVTVPSSQRASACSAHCSSHGQSLLPVLVVGTTCDAPFVKVSQEEAKPSDPLNNSLSKLLSVTDHPVSTIIETGKVANSETVNVSSTMESASVNTVHDAVVHSVTLPYLNNEIPNSEWPVVSTTSAIGATDSNLTAFSLETCKKIDNSMVVSTPSIISGNNSSTNLKPIDLPIPAHFQQASSTACLIETAEDASASSSSEPAYNKDIKCEQSDLSSLPVSCDAEEPMPQEENDSEKHNSRISKTEQISETLPKVTVNISVAGLEDFDKNVDDNEGDVVLNQETVNTMQKSALDAIGKGTLSLVQKDSNASSLLCSTPQDNLANADLQDVEKLLLISPIASRQPGSNSNEFPSCDQDSFSSLLEDCLPTEGSKTTGSALTVESELLDTETFILQSTFDSTSDQYASYNEQTLSNQANTSIGDLTSENINSANTVPSTTVSSGLDSQLPQSQPQQKAHDPPLTAQTQPLHKPSDIATIPFTSTTLTCVELTLPPACSATTATIVHTPVCTESTTHVSLSVPSDHNLTGNNSQEFTTYNINHKQNDSGKPESDSTNVKVTQNNMVSYQAAAASSVAVSQLSNIKAVASDVKKAQFQQVSNVATAFTSSLEKARVSHHEAMKSQMENSQSQALPCHSASTGLYQAPTSFDHCMTSTASSHKGNFPQQSVSSWDGNNLYAFNANSTAAFQASMQRNAYSAGASNCMQQNLYQGHDNSKSVTQNQASHSNFGSQDACSQKNSAELHSFAAEHSKKHDIGTEQYHNNQVPGAAQKFNSYSSFYNNYNNSYMNFFQNHGNQTTPSLSSLMSGSGYNFSLANHKMLGGQQYLNSNQGNNYASSSNFNMNSSSNYANCMNQSSLTNNVGSNMNSNINSNFPGSFFPYYSNYNSYPPFYQGTDMGFISPHAAAASLMPSFSCMPSRSSVSQRNSSSSLNDFSFQSGFFPMMPFVPPLQCNSPRGSSSPMSSLSPAPTPKPYNNSITPQSPKPSQHHIESANKSANSRGSAVQRTPAATTSTKNKKMPSNSPTKAAHHKSTTVSHNPSATLLDTNTSNTASSAFPGFPGNMLPFTYPPFTKPYVGSQASQYSMQASNAYSYPHHESMYKSGIGIPNFDDVQSAHTKLMHHSSNAQSHPGGVCGSASQAYFGKDAVSHAGIQHCPVNSPTNQFHDPSSVKTNPRGSKNEKKLAASSKEYKTKDIKGSSKKK